MKVSIVIAYYNRKNLLINTLKSIEFYNKERDIEVIIVDDASDKKESISDIPAQFAINVYVIHITKEEKKWTNPCIPYNIGFSFAIGDIIIIQNPESLHVGDIVGYALSNTEKGTYINFAAYSLSQVDSKRLYDNVLSKNIFTADSIKKSIGTTIGFLKEIAGWKDGDSCWYNHSKYNPGGNHFCSAITRRDLEELSGFDERYALGFAFDDTELVARIKRGKMIFSIIDEPFVIHQHHKSSAYANHKEGYKRNESLYVTGTAKESFYKASHNSFYCPGIINTVVIPQDKWQLNKIPKILHVYFEGFKLSFIRYLTVVSFIRLNPDWQVVFYHSKYPSKIHSWNGTEQKYSDDWDDYTSRLLNLPIKVTEVDFNVLGMSNDMSAVHKSDALRWHLLSVIGGLWCDMDILYLRPVTDLALNIEVNKDIDTVVCIGSYGHSIGFLMSAPDNGYFKTLFFASKNNYNKNDYQCIGSSMCNTLFPSMSTIKNKLPGLSPGNLGMEAVYLYDANQTSEIFGDALCPLGNSNTIGVHWYAGSVLAGKYMAETNGGLIKRDNMIGKLVQDEISHYRIGVAIVNLNQLTLTKKCISDLQDQVNENFDIFLYDQSSDEKGTHDYLDECECRDITVFRNSENVPLNHIWNNFKNICHNEYLCFLNNDTELSNMFIDDTLNIFNLEYNAGFVIHVTNNPDYLKTKKKLEYKMLNPPYYQGWDFTIRRNLMPEIPQEMLIFGGDDYIFANVVHKGYGIALAYSSPIIHHNSKTRATISNIAEIQKKDSANLYRILKEEGLTQIDITINNTLCGELPHGMKIIQ